MEIRVAEYKDYERIAQLHADSWKIYYRGILADQYLDQDVLEDRSVIWQTRLINPPFNQHVLLLEEGGLLVGFVCAFGNHNFDRGTFIDALHVDNAYRGRGIGKRLLSELSERLEQYYADSGLYLEVMSKNKQAIGFYESIGGKEELEQIWDAPCGSKVKEKVYSWPSPSTLAQQLQTPA
ncbi:N-acetyltransferase [Vibrio fortis]|jgi:ribosomal protein S18 acetylase RimI-like enzyme|uniref:GNAT family N-acetyltransferase n=1 Tax=Vibrio fortis TaxID=212667 RepID=A0A066UT29_9VIBR|nr:MULTISPECIES: N-acetyltransferase [Vibrio]KAB0289376.1 GNAT family N-acetyltransferase [Vibrio fortis]KAB0300812.1 GNAT family N-acetyltransferase [Vibrio fortis]KDN27284.1 histone acetyltransferase [Vibrio fortis]MDK9760907.1 GNAT family N-acetyltransferase [Vibrio sp. D420a]QFT11281.1 putative acetyltransferase [Vibrio sp. THAF190c]|tara:strand:- start:2493 stop:3032 length:540 start_codon:yes stop_codon:yes gene_type:complete